MWLSYGSPFALDPQDHSFLLLTHSLAAQDVAGFSLLHFFSNHVRSDNRSPDTPDTAMVKRVLAVAGDWVRPRHGSVVQVPKGETFVQEESAHSYLFYFRMAGHCWVEGDNSGHSYDSNAFGAVPVALVRNLHLAYYDNVHSALLLSDVRYYPFRSRVE